MLDPADQIAAVLVMAGLFSFVNHRWLHLSDSIGLFLIAFASALSLIVLNRFAPGLGIGDWIDRSMTRLDFARTLLDLLLGMLLFGGVLHLNVRSMQIHWRAIAVLVVIGVPLSIVLIALALEGVLHFFVSDPPFVWLLVFAALITPTDPVAVLEVLKRMRLPSDFTAVLAGESLFNDGLGIFAFTSLLGVAVGTSGELGAVDLATDVLWESGGAIALGIAVGWVAQKMSLSVDDEGLLVLISFASIFAITRTAAQFHMSGPIAVVVFGLFITAHVNDRDTHRRATARFRTFWRINDSLLNTILFLLVGFTVTELGHLEPNGGWGTIIAFTLATVAAVVGVRFVVVWSLLLVLPVLGERVRPGMVALLSWGGLRGGIPIALALTIPDSGHDDALLLMAISVVAFSIVVQGLTIAPVARRVIGPEPSEAVDAQG
ncbi:MAG: cation:proton antiporter [bacterium]|nr:cation:proton antiporter [bacterium]